MPDRFNYSDSSLSAIFTQVERVQVTCYTQRYHNIHFSLEQSELSPQSLLHQIIQLADAVY
jgi:hypothetical protein